MPNEPKEFYQPSRCNYIYLCQIAADGTFTMGPAGWSVDKFGTGKYKIVHELNHTRFAVFPVISGVHKNTATVLDVDDTSVTISTFAVNDPADIMFQLLLIAVQ